MLGKKKINIIFIIMLTTILPLFLLNLASCRLQTPAAETYTIKKGDIILSVSSTGTVDAVDKRNYSLQSSGEILEVLDKGKLFKKNDILVKIDNTKTKLLISQAEESLKSAQGAIDIANINFKHALDANHIAIQIAESSAKQSGDAASNALKALEDANEIAEASLNSANISINNANDYLETVKKSPLSTEIQIKQAEGSINSANAAYDQAQSNAEAQTDQANLAYDQALNNQSLSYWNNLGNKETAAAQIKLMKKNIEQSKVQLELSKINLEIAKLDVNKNVIDAPFDGIVLLSNYNVGELASPGPVISIIGNNFVIKADINETDIDKLVTGQEVDLTFDAYPDKHFPGKISAISPVSKNAAGIVTFEVTVKPDDSVNSHLKYGLSANLDIVISKTLNVLIVPTQSVYEENAKKYVDMPAKDGKTVNKVEVVTGASDYENIEIISGLKEGDTIFTSRVQTPAASINTSISS